MSIVNFKYGQKIQILVGECKSVVANNNIYILENKKAISGV